MELWAEFWTWLLIGAVAVFAGLAVVVTIGGFFDVRALLRGIDAKHAEEPPEDETEAGYFPP
ncbi:MAG: hypothetical protein JXB62_14010 [Pirellulales bacterium]|nr:hypothetical protein [Pirellulales bacterium]